MDFRNLRADEIDVKVGQIGDGWATLMLYKDARVDMAILDETVGAENWQRKHYDCKGTMFCSVGIKIDGEWVWKDDAGAPSDYEKEKGEASDSFKRACTNWGIGRELYSIRNICVKLKTKHNSKGKVVLDGDLYIEKIKIENKEIVGLAIKQVGNENRVYVYTKKENGDV